MAPSPKDPKSLLTPALKNSLESELWDLTAAGKGGNSYFHAQRLGVSFLHSSGSLIQQGPCCGLVTTASGEHKPSGVRWESSLGWRCAHIASFRSFLMGGLRTKDVPSKPTHAITGAFETVIRIRGAACAFPRTNSSVHTRHSWEPLRARHRSFVAFLPWF